MTDHIWRTDEHGQVDLFAYDFEFEGVGHNGPRCTVCGEGFCMHCEPDLDALECEGFDWTTGLPGD